MKNKLLIEIGVEEFPSTYIEKALDSFAQILKTFLQKERLFEGDCSVKTVGTPRRLVFFVEGVETKQIFKEEHFFGPLREACKNDKGEWSQAALGFARKKNISIEEMSFKKDHKGKEKLYVSKPQDQMNAEDMLKDNLPNLLMSIKTPKTMRFRAFSSCRFARPVRWLVAFFNDKVIPFEAFGLLAQNKTYGHRFLTNNESIVLKDADFLAYIKTMNRAYVMVDPLDRLKVIKNLITEAVEKYCEEPLWQDIWDESLLNKVVHSVEYPNVLLGEFSEDFLKIPDFVIISSMKFHQKFFPVLDKKRGLLPYFLSIVNGAQNKTLVTEGNERVLAARLADACFFWKEDLKYDFQNRYEELKSMMYRRDVGSYWDKVESTRKLASDLCEKVGFDSNEKDLTDRALKLSKIDLLSNMVYEFPELQGKVGAKYSEIAGEDPKVVHAVEEQYRMKSLGLGEQNKIAHMVILSERLDTLQTAFSLETKVTGSSDPYGLRRAAITLIDICACTGWSLSIEDQKLLTFILDRLRGYAQDEKSIRPDIIESVLNVFDKRKGIDVSDLLFKMETIQKASENIPVCFEEFLDISERVVNIYKKAKSQKIGDGDIAIDPQLFSTDIEKRLFSIFLESFSSKNMIFDEKYFQKVVDLLKEPFEIFFSEVMVFCEDKKQSFNRLSLLAQFVTNFEQFADFSCLNRMQKI
ncbi:glycine--tRNA ligase subunit beta [PVC group bacterium (ex Bugula neritina AB1)]|nr:glycine--tRNA ligase subunit beta [PVC group bacterium (ex Bugula neritina AB1)]